MEDNKAIDIIQSRAKGLKPQVGIILGSGCGGGLVVDKKIVTGTNGLGGEWGHNQIPYFAAKKENLETSNLRDAEIESFISGHALNKRFNKIVILKKSLIICELSMSIIFRKWLKICKYA